MIGEAPVASVVRHGRAMATDVTVWVVDAEPDRAGALAEQALGVFASVEAECSRFDPHSALSLANASPERWHALPHFARSSVVEAWRAYQLTGGRFDPRVLGDLTALGYHQTLPSNGGISFPNLEPRQREPLAPWNLRTRRFGWPAAQAPGARAPGANVRVNLGGIPVDLGGIGKGLAVRWASDALRAGSACFMVSAGGDCSCAGHGPEGQGWSVGVEDPLGSEVPLAVLRLVDRACCTSSVRVRRWKAGGVDVHHLIDPSTGLPGGEGLLAVTVVGEDPARSEVWSKALFLAGAAGVADLADAHGIAALWVDGAGGLSTNAHAAPYVSWTRP